MPTQDRYLAEVTSYLTLPDELKAEILEELAVHLGDTVAGLQEAGLSEQAAEAEALSRLGPPAALARALVAARRRPAQLLAAAGAGTWAAIGSGFTGAAGALLVVLLAAIVGSIATRQVAGALGIYPTGWTGEWNTVLTGVVFAVGALYAGAAAVSGVARRGWRAPSEVRPVVAVVGGFLIAFLVLVLFEAALNWASVIALALVPAAFAVGTQVDTVRPLRVRILGVLCLAATAVVLTVGVATFAAAGQAQSYSWNADSVGAGILPQWWGGSSRRANALFGTTGSRSSALGVETVEYQVANPGAIAQLSDFRLEAWIGQPPQDDWHLAPGQTGPFAVAPAELDGTTLSGTIIFNQAPNIDWAEVVLTAVGPDGQRYLLDASGPEQTQFFGSVWSWFAALAR